MLQERCYRRLLLTLVTAAGLFGARPALAVDPQLLESAYWRFEEGVADGYVPAPPVAEQGSDGPGGIYTNTALDSINQNHMRAFNVDTAPKYVNYSLPPTPLKSGASNTLAWEVDGSSTGGRDVYTINKNIQNGIIGGGFDDDNVDETPPIPSTTTGFTLEAAFNVFDLSSTRAIIAKEGRPGLEQANNGGQVGDEVFQSLPTLTLKVRGPQFEGDPDAGKLQIELFDGAGNLKSVMTGESVAVGQWVYAAVTNDGETLSLYLDRNNGQGYQLVGSEALDGALFQGMNHDDASWNKNWTIGRSVYGGIDDGTPADWFNGLIDEVRLTNEVLPVTDFLFYQEPAGLDGDFNADGVVDGADFLKWQRGESPNPLSADDLTAWRTNYGAGPGAAAAAGAVPEPAAATLLGLALGGAAIKRRRSSYKTTPPRAATGL